MKDIPLKEVNVFETATYEVKDLKIPQENKKAHNGRVYANDRSFGAEFVKDTVEQVEKNIATQKKTDQITRPLFGQWPGWCHE